MTYCLFPLWRDICSLPHYDSARCFATPPGFSESIYWLLPTFSAPPRVSYWAMKLSGERESGWPALPIISPAAEWPMGDGFGFRYSDDIDDATRSERFSTEYRRSYSSIQHDYYWPPHLRAAPLFLLILISLSPGHRVTIAPPHRLTPRPLCPLIVRAASPGQTFEVWKCHCRP